MNNKNRNWIWFFVVLFTLGIAAIWTNYWYNMRQQLKPEALLAAREKWKLKGPKDYDLRIRKELSPASGGELSREEFFVQVRGGQVTKATTHDGRELEPRLLPKYDVSAWFDYMEEFMERDTKPGAPPVFCRAEFDDKDGHPLRYVRRVMGNRERCELNFELKPIR